MDKLLTAAFAQLRRPVVWVLGGMAAVGGELLTAFLPALPTADSLAFDPNNLQEELLVQTQQFFLFIAQTERVIGYLLAAVVALLILWLLSAFAHGGLIAAVGLGQEGVGPNLRTAAGWLWRVLLLDTVLLFPPFLVALFMLLTASWGAISLATEEVGVTADDLLRTITLTLAGITLLACCLVPVGLFIALLRHLALRAATLGQMATRASIRWAWQALRHHLGLILLAVFVLWVVGLGVGVLATPLNALETAVPPLAIPIFALRWSAAAGVAGFGSAVWTLLYQHLAPKTD